MLLTLLLLLAGQAAAQCKCKSSWWYGWWKYHGCAKTPGESKKWCYLEPNRVCINGCKCRQGGGGVWDYCGGDRWKGRSVEFEPEMNREDMPEEEVRALPEGEFDRATQAAGEPEMDRSMLMDATGKTSPAPMVALGLAVAAALAIAACAICRLVRKQETLV